MAMDSTELGDALADLTDLSALPTEQQEKVRQHWREIAGVIIDHITARAEVSVNLTGGQSAMVPGSPPGPTTTLSNASGPVAGILVSPGPTNGNTEWTGTGTIE